MQREQVLKGFLCTSNDGHKSYTSEQTFATFDDSELSFFLEVTGDGRDILLCYCNG